MKKTITTIVNDAIPEVGDIVKIISTGKLYTTYPDFFTEHSLGLFTATRYQYGISLETNDENQEYNVLYIGNHHSFKNTKLAVIEERGYWGMGKVYLIETDGLEYVHHDDTIKAERAFKDYKTKELNF